MIDSLIKHLEKTENNIIYYSIIINNNPHVQGLSWSTKISETKLKTKTIQKQEDI